MQPYINSGRFWDPPGSFDSFTQSVFSGCNQDLEPAGVSGGTAFRLSLDTKHYYDFALVSPFLPCRVYFSSF